MIGGSTFPTVEDEGFIVVVEAFAVVVVDAESLLSELQPATARLATASAAIPAITRRFFKGFSKE